MQVESEDGENGTRIINATIIVTSPLLVTGVKVRNLANKKIYEVEFWERDENMINFLVVLKPGLYEVFLNIVGSSTEGWFRANE